MLEVLHRKTIRKEIWRLLRMPFRRWLYQIKHHAQQQKDFNDNECPTFLHSKWCPKWHFQASVESHFLWWYVNLKSGNRLCKSRLDCLSRKERKDSPREQSIDNRIAFPNARQTQLSQERFPCQSSWSVSVRGDNHLKINCKTKTWLKSHSSAPLLVPGKNKKLVSNIQFPFTKYWKPDNLWKDLGPLVKVMYNGFTFRIGAWLIEILLEEKIKKYKKEQRTDIEIMAVTAVRQHWVILLIQVSICFTLQNKSGPDSWACRSWIIRFLYILYASCMFTFTSCVVSAWLDAWFYNLVPIMFEVRKSFLTRNKTVRKLGYLPSNISLWNITADVRNCLDEYNYWSMKNTQ